MQTLHGKVPGLENPQPSCCEMATLTTAPLCHTVRGFIHLFKSHSIDLNTRLLKALRATCRCKEARHALCTSGFVISLPTGCPPPMGRRLMLLPPTLLHWTQRRAVTPWGPKEAPHRRQRERPSPHAVFLMLSRRTERRLRTDGQTGGHKVGTS